MNARQFHAAYAKAQREGQSLDLVVHCPDHPTSHGRTLQKARAAGYRSSRHYGGRSLLVSGIIDGKKETYNVCWLQLVS